MEVPIRAALLCISVITTLTVVVTQDCPEVANCETCSNPDQECTVCGPGKVLRPDGSGCDDCPSACGKCINTDECLECYNSFNGHNYVLSSFGICERCSAHCVKCHVSVNDRSTKCEQCEDGYAVDERTDACSSCPLGCEKCIFQTDVLVCSEVNIGYRLDDSVITHVAVCDANCAECDKTSCTKCVDDFYVAADGTCQSCSSKCTECDEEKCDVCYEGYGTKSAPTCEACPANCERCDRGGCIECASGYAPDSDETYRECHRCPLNCHTCVYTNDHRTTCVENGCDELFARDPASGLCHGCDENCLSSCIWKTQLEDDFLYRFNSVEIIVDVNGPACLNCKRGYGTTHHGQCAKCPDKCIACFDDTKYEEMVIQSEEIPRMSCFDTDCGFEMGSDAYVINGVTFPRIWEINSEHIVIDGLPPPAPAPPAPAPAPEPRKRRSREHIKIRKTLNDRKRRAVLQTDDDMTYTAGFGKDDCCEFGYTYIQHDVFLTEVGGNAHYIYHCGACPDHCVICIGNQPHLCYQCEPGYAPSDDRTECLASTPYCYDTNSGTWDDCDVCFPFHENADHRVNVKYDGALECIKCPDNCLWSDGDVSGDTNCQLDMNVAECMTCRDYYGVIGGQCERCEDKCVTCAWTDAATPVYSCSECDDRTVLVNNLECVHCPVNCADCDTTDGSTCIDCDPGYIIDSNDLCVACPDACFASGDCTYDGEADATACTSCDAGWVLKDGQCDECSDNCATCILNDEGNNVCDACVQFYGLMDDGTCTQCPSDCAECSNGVCDVCSSGFFRNTEDCGYCGGGCETCTESSGTMSCSKCFNGFVIDINKNCIACPNDCDVCAFTNGELMCSECAHGFLVSGQGTCASCEDVTGVQSCESCHLEGQTAVCNKCIKGYSLKDDASICISCVHLENCNGADDECADLSHVCSECSAGFDLENGQCGIGCVVCTGGNDVCGSDLAYNQTTFCPTGNCFVGKSTVDNSAYFSRGCDYLGWCDDSSNCNTGGNETCFTCCSTDMCNAVDLSSTTVTMANKYVTTSAMLITLLILSMH